MISNGCALSVVRIDRGCERLLKKSGENPLNFCLHTEWTPCKVQFKLVFIVSLAGGWLWFVTACYRSYTMYRRWVFNRFLNAAFDRVLTFGVRVAGLPRSDVADDFGQLHGGAAVEKGQTDPQQGSGQRHGCHMVSMLMSNISWHVRVKVSSTTSSRARRNPFSTGDFHSTPWNRADG